MPKVLFTIKLTEFQRDECEHGLEVDDTDGKEPWGRVLRTGKKAASLRVYDINDALYRVTSSRDICSDNAGSDMVDSRERLAYASQARSLQLLTDKIVRAAGGPEAFAENMKRYI